jgi:hypothetical protein
MVITTIMERIPRRLPPPILGKLSATALPLNTPTSTSFEKAIGHGDDYDTQIAALEAS